jgi:tetratricopeptide (TPR) repeat protein
LRPLPGLVAAAIAAATAAAFAGALELGFLFFDDPLYVTGNPRVQAGLTFEGVGWAFQTLHASNWHPLTWLSHMLDCAWFGLEPAGHHATSVALHALNAALLYALLVRYTGSWPAAAGAALLFALHPLRVESVAWVAERKDVLSGAFALGALLAWDAWARRGARAGYAGALALFALGLLAKPMLVTLPLLLLALDYWPYGRLAPGRAAFGRLLLEKAPLLALTAASSLVTLVAQRTSIAYADAPLLAARLENAMVALARYLAKTLWPSGLVALYPQPPGWPALALAGALAAILAIGALAWAQRGRRPWLAVGFAWFALALLPVLGIVPIGRQSMADRYTYLPHVGLAIALAAGLAEQARRGMRHRVVVGALVAAAAVAELAVTRAQIPHWRDEVSVWARVLAVEPGSAFAHQQYGAALGLQGNLPAAIGELREALRLYQGAAARTTGEQALERQPDLARTHFDLARALQGSGDHAAAVAHYAQATGLWPEWADAQWGLGMALLKAGDVAAARASLARAAELDPRAWQPHYGLGLIAEAAGDRAAARQAYAAALARSPGERMVTDRLGRLDGANAR